jgi:transposase
LDGKLFLLTSLKSAAFDAKTIVTRYKALADIERGFRTLKSELLIAPMTPHINQINDLAI